MALNCFPSISKKLLPHSSRTSDLIPHTGGLKLLLRGSAGSQNMKTVSYESSRFDLHLADTDWPWAPRQADMKLTQKNWRKVSSCVPASRSYSLQMISSHECLPHIMALHRYLQTLDTAQWSRKVLPWTLWTVDPGKPERRRTRRPPRGPSGPALPGATLRKHSHAYACKFWSAGLNPTVCPSVTTLTGFFGGCAQPRPCEVVKPTVVP